MVGGVAGLRLIAQLRNYGAAVLLLIRAFLTAGLHFGRLNILLDVILEEIVAEILDELLSAFVGVVGDVNLFLRDNSMLWICQKGLFYQFLFISFNLS